MVRVPRKVGWPVVAAWGAAVFWFAAQRAVYHPWKYPRGWWELRDQLGASDVWMQAADGVKLHGWWLAPENPRRVTLYLHGNVGNVTHRGLHARRIVAAGSGVLLLDYRGYGRSEGRPGEEGLYADAGAAYDWLIKRGFSPGQIVIHGESLGTSVAVDLAARRPCAGVILEAPFTSANEMAARVLPLLGPLVMHAFDTRSKIAAVHAPLLIIHGDRDEVVPYALGRALFDAAREPKRFFTAAGCGHNDIPEAPGYGGQLRAFYALASELQTSQR